MKNNPKKKGRPRTKWVIVNPQDPPKCQREIDLALVERLASTALREEDIAVKGCGVGLTTIKHNPEIFEQFREAVNRGRVNCRATLMATAFKNAIYGGREKCGNVAMQIFLLKNLCGFTDRTEHEVDVKQTRVILTPYEQREAVKILTDLFKPKQLGAASDSSDSD